MAAEAEGARTPRRGAPDALRERLTRLQDRLKRERANLRVLDEQVAFLHGVADDAETRKLVAETPLADRTWREAQKDLEGHERAAQEARDEIEALDAQRDKLLEQLFELEGLK